jgi:hypothetical protein
MSLATQTIIDHLPVDIPLAGVVGEIVAQFQEYADRCSCLKATGLGVCNLVLGPAGDKTNVAARLEEIAGQLRIARGGQEAPRDLTSWARGLVLREPDGVPPLAVALSPSSPLRSSKTQVSMVALNGVQWGAASTNYRPIALPQVGGRVGPVGVWLQHRPIVRQDGNSLDPDPLCLRVLVLMGSAISHL